MPCYKPLEAWHSAELNANGRRPLVFKFDANTCGQPIEIACGQCIGCKLERSRQWAIRCHHELQLHENNTYITLTYNDEHLPEDGSLDKSHFQLFMKRYRQHLYRNTQKLNKKLKLKGDNRLKSPKISYFMCGEYGERCADCKLNKKDCFNSNANHEFLSELARPHYHAIIFGDDFDDKYHFKTVNDFPYYRSPTLEKLWGKGHCTIGEANFKSAAYIARYITKKITGDKAEQHYKIFNTETGVLHDVIPEYANPSRNPAIAKNWYEQYKRDLDKGFITIDGTKIPIPKYYNTLLDREDDPEYAYDIELRKLNKMESIRIADKSDNTRERLQVKEHIKRKKLKLLTRGFEQ
ncbi:replication initiator protein [Microviridae sp.]|nr:replication initiator protein [Microviridae sp.]